MSTEETTPENDPETTSEPSGEAVAEDENPSLREQYEAAIAERDANHDRWLRTQAEMENMRKRNNKERDDLNKFRSLDLLRDMLPAMDNLQRAIDASQQNPQGEELLQGIQMVAQQFAGVLNKHSIEPIEALGQPFDPNRHEALQQIPTSEHPPMTVIQELEKGYLLHDRVVRPSKVLVSAPLPEATEEPAKTE